MKADINIHVIQDAKAFEEIRTHWNNLLFNSPNQSAFLTWEWLYSWWATNGAGRQLWIVTARRGTELTGIAPLMLETRNHAIRVLTNLGTPQSDVGGVIHKPDDHETVNAIFEFLIKHKSNWDILELNEIPQTWVEQFTPGNLFPEHGFWQIETSNQHFFISLDAGDWETYSQRLSGKFRYNLRRAVRLAEERGRVELKRHRGRQVNDEVIDTIIEINRHAHYPRLFASSAEQALLRELARQMTSELAGFEAYILYLDNQPVAYEYGFSISHRFEDWRSGFDTRVPPNISIGKVLAMQVAQACISEKYTEIDFLRGDESYKKEWKPSDRHFSQIRVFNRRKITALLSYLWLTKIKPRIGKGITQELATPPSSEED